MNSEKKHIPKLAESEEVASAFGVSPKRKASDKLIENFIPTRNDPISKSVVKIVKALLSLIFALLVALLVTWLILISTVAATPNINGQTLIVDRNSWSEGGAEPGDISYASAANSKNLLEKIKFHITGEINNGATIKIVATPLDYVNTNLDGRVVVNGTRTLYSSDIIIDRKQLGDTYLAECLEGSCGIPGTLYEIPIANAIGSVEGILKFFRVEEYAR